MIRFVLGRLVLAAVLLVAVISASFAIVSLMPGDPAHAVLGEFATPQQVADLNAKLGLNQPVLTQWWHYLTSVLSGDLGTSFFSGAPVSQEIMVRLLPSLLVVIPGLLLAVTLGTAMGAVSAYRRGGHLDRALSGYTSATLALPEFALALIIIYVFFQVLRIAPAPLGMLSPLDPVPPKITGSVLIDAALSGSWQTIGGALAHAVLPIVTLGIFFSAFFARVVRTGLSAALLSPQVEFARACGLSEWMVFRYAMGDIRRTLLTFLVILTGAALSGAVILETVFSWPGIGTWALKGILQVDIPVIQGFVLIIASTLLFAYVAVDILIAFIDPRVRAQVTARKATRTHHQRPAPVVPIVNDVGPA
ncbi:ABC transporter permease [Microbacterium capsulatum]|uniref:ABC transporter permease n=1 Tax=Microbacterium capsulatum TaxID=3041921 RepID=A0ABU0XHP5_9MICO|nr:ABC transporter permease [Microbacterium sp. ASV81]MDQ4214648.1 ABC transporter permease [Microbacterium sp. ASV81]